jgi:hypothetical protein
MVRRSTIECRVESQKAKSSSCTITAIHSFTYLFSWLFESFDNNYISTTASLNLVIHPLKLNSIDSMILIQLNSLIYSNIFLQLDIGLGLFVELPCL